MTTAQLDSAWPQPVPIGDGQLTLPPAGTWKVWWGWLGDQPTAFYAPHGHKC